jgi:undecaprenyl-diphosphatase
MAFSTDHSAPIEQIESNLAAHSALKSGFLAWRERLAEADLALVHRCSRSTRYAPIRRLAVMTSQLGNGWVYPVLIALILLAMPMDARLIFIAGAVNAAVLHIIYPMLKKRFRRPRPFHIDPSLKSLLPTRDEFSFPSGHVMTLSGVLLPVMLSMPGAALPALGLILLMAWSRIATAHHFPSDVLVGAALGAIIGLPLSSLMS